MGIKYIGIRKMTEVQYMCVGLRAKVANIENNIVIDAGGVKKGFAADLHALESQDGARRSCYCKSCSR